MEYKKALDYIINRLRNELPNHLKYHAVEHTLSVIDASRKQALYQDIKGEDMQLLLTAAAYHDSGFMLTYKHHEVKGCAIAEEHLPKFGFSTSQIERIKALIMATKIPQSPKTSLEQILCDADLHYLGEEYYDSIAQDLREELALNGTELTDKEWLQLQIRFLEEHHYWTPYYQEVFTPKKQQVLKRLKNQLQSVV